VIRREQRPDLEQLPDDPLTPTISVLLGVRKSVFKALTFADNHVIHVTSVDVPDSNAAINVSRGEDEVFAKIETGPIISLRRISQLALGCAASESGRINR
jgi:hypothetical protein